MEEALIVYRTDRQCRAGRDVMDTDHSPEEVDQQFSGTNSAVEAAVVK
jgi:hypothetical protein